MQKQVAFFQTWNDFLYKYHLYYRNLSEKGKLRFAKRVESVLNNVEIIGKESLEINDEIRILVISNLVELTFGLKEFWLYGYEYISLYPEAFFVKSKGDAVSGSTYQNKIISLSWQDFAMDHLHAKTGKNISLAQYALALVRTVFNGKHYDLKFGSYLDTWFEIIKKECAAKADGTSMQHLNENADDLPIVFSKCVEMFFEKPELFKRDLPNSYAHFCLLLNQNPLNIAEDYAYNREDLNKRNLYEPLPQSIPYNFKYKQWHWTYNFVFFGPTLCPMVLYFLHGALLVQPENIAIFITLAGIFMGIVLYEPLKRMDLFYNRWLLLANGIFGYSPCLVTFLLVINQIHGYSFSAKESKHKIASFYQKVQTNNQDNPQSITFNFSDEYLINYPKARTFESFDIPPTNTITLFNGVNYEIRNGLLGIPIITKRELY
jgi:Mlc titration factor MtfA (ptsG expression regulator)